MEKLIQLTLEVRQLEESLQSCVHFKSNVENWGTSGSAHKEVSTKDLRFNSAVLTTSYNKLREARMLLGDLLRMVGVEHPYKNSYVGKLVSESPMYMENGGLKTINWDEVILDVGGDRTSSKEAVCLGIARTKLGNANDRTGLFYQLNAMFNDINAGVFHHIESHPDLFIEFSTYFYGAAEALKLANYYLGLRFGELV